MDIHELNTFSGTLGASDYLATDNGDDTSKVSVQTLLAPLNARIDNIIAGPTSSAEEVVDARLGATELRSTNYPSLGEAVRGQVGELYDSITDLAERGYLELHPVFEKGGITDGANSTFNSAFRMVSNLTLTCDAVIQCETGFRYLIAYYQPDGTFISQTALTTADTVLPKGTTFRILIRKQPDQYIPDGTDPSVFTDHVHIMNIAKSRADFEALSIEALFNYQEADFTTADGITSGSRINTDSAYYKHYTKSVVEGELVRVAGVNFRSASYPLYRLKNGDTTVSYYHENTDANVFMTKTFFVPAGVDTLVVNDSINIPSDKRGIFSPASNEELIDELSGRIEDATTYYTENNNVLWVGTSIPEGATYPEEACKANGYNCTNNSLGSSKLCFEGEYISGADINKGKRLTATVAELESLYRADVTNGIISEATLNMWKNYSYENSILPYINGTNETQVSMIVLDHGYNDRATIHTQMQNVEGIDWTSTNRATFTGAFKYLLNKIQEINPFIKIVISGYFTNTVERLDFNYYSKDICNMQSLIGEKYDLSVMKAWEHTQINPVHVAGTNNYISNFNSQYGTSYAKITPDANGNITALQLYCPDGIHPHSDLTGNCNRRLNAVYTKLLAHSI